MTRKTRSTLRLLGVRQDAGPHDAEIDAILLERGVDTPWVWTFGTSWSDDDTDYAIFDRPSAGEA